MKKNAGLTAAVLFLTASTLTAGVLIPENIISLSGKTYIISILIIFYIISLFFASFENRKPEAREIVIIAVMSAIAIAGRSVFFFLPQFKPVTAIVIITGVCFGAEAGFLTGAVSGFVSNFFFGQGPWTPWQMLGFGLAGFFAGIIFRQGGLKKTRLNLCAYGAFATLIFYGGLVNFSTVLFTGAEITPASILSIYAAGMAFDMIHVAATVIFLFLIANVMIEKLERIKVKYGFMER